MQEGMLFHTMKDNDSYAYFEQIILSISGNINVDYLEESLNRLIEKYDILRTIFLYENVKQPMQVVLKERKTTIYYEDLTHMENDQKEAYIDSFIKQDRDKGFSLSRDLLIRLFVLKTGIDEYQLVISHHHIIMDGWCTGTVIQNLLKMYKSRLNGQPLLLERTSPYSLYLEWLDEQNGEEGQSYWQEYLQGYEQFTSVPRKQIEKNHTSNYQQRFTFNLDKELTSKLSELTTTYKVTMNTLVQTIWGILLQRYNNVEDVVFGAVVSGRPPEIEGVEDIVGLFINTIPVRIQSNKQQTFSELLKQMQEKALNSECYNYLSLAEIQSKSTLSNQLIDHIMVFENYPLNNASLHQDPTEIGFSITDVELFEQTNYDFELEINYTEELSITIAYNLEMYSKEFVRNIASHIQQISETVVYHPNILLEEIDLVNETEKQQILVDFNCTELEYDKTKTIQDLFEEQVEKTPDEVAVVYEKQQLTYFKLNERANQLARVLRQHEVGKEQVVGILLDRSIDMVVAALGVLKAGGAYLPIDSENPMERIVYMLEDSQVSVLLMHKHNQVPVGYKGQFVFVDDEDLYVGQDATSVENINTPQDIAYIIYTSGSTGNPKGVMIEHQSVNNLRLSAETFGIGLGSRVLQCASFSFDQSIGDMYYTILNGGTLYISSKELLLSGERFINWLHENQISSIPGISPSILKMLPYMELPHLKTISTGGEALSADLVRTWGVNRTFLNAYGPTEATVDSTIGVCRPDMDIAPIGKPIFNKKVYILNSQYQVQPVGVAGEMYIGGDGLARGYLNRPDLTSEQFVPNPFVPGEQMYKTGDLVRWLPDGNIEYLGRVDNQVKIRGHRIEIGEIETCLRKHPSIKEAVVIARKDKNEQDYLCAYVVAQGEWTIQILRQFLGQTLPHYMIPSYFMELSEIPLTTNGKVDKKAMPEPGGKVKVTEEYVPPTNRTEEILTQIWEEVLGVEQVGIHDNFFELGGHSIKATMMAGRIQKQLGVLVSLRDLFGCTNIKEMACYIKRARSYDYDPIKPIPKQELYPASSQQEQMVIIHGLEGDGVGTSYNMASIFVLEGKLDISSFRSALKRLLSRHESLRTTFNIVEGQIVQKIHSSVPWELIISEASYDEIEEHISAFVRPFNLEEAPLFRTELSCLGDEKYLFMMDMHHSISDGVSIDLLLEELMLLYKGMNLPELSIQYKDYSAWQQSPAQRELLKQQESYWEECFSEGVPLLHLPTDYQRPPIQQFKGEILSTKIELPILQKLKEMSNKQGATLFMTLLASYNVLLAKYSGQEDIVIGTPTAGRSHPDTEKIVGVFINSLAIRNFPNFNMSFSEFLLNVKERVLDAYEHSEYPFEEIIDKFNLRGDISHNPLFDVMFNMETVDANKYSIDELKITPYEFYVNSPSEAASWDVVQTDSQVDISLDILESTDSLFLSVEYNTYLFNQKTIRRLIENYTQILEQVIQQPDILLSEIELVTQAEKQQLLKDFNNTQVNYDKEKTIQELFEAQVKKTPNQLAVIFEDVGFTYQELNERANQLARVLRRKGVKPEQIVGILGDRSIETIVSILGVIKSGGAYLSIDPDYPEERIEYMLQDSSVSLLLAQRESTIPQSYQGECIFMDDKVMLQEDNSNLKNLNTSRSLAYVIYTSGSTGKPKGVMIEHGGVNNLRLMAPTYGIQEGSRILQFASFSFDASVGDVFHTLLSGATLYLLKKENLLEGEGFTKWLHEKRITSIPFIPPSILKTIPYVELPYLKTISTGGESLSIDLVKVWGVNRTFLNAYGPTEATVDSTIGVCVPEMEIMSIGRPIANKKVYILNEQYQLQPVGVPGEMYIGGDGLARGYLNRPELTEERFVSNPFVSEERMYKTGDLARWLPDGSIEYLGRVDDQVKIRGHRIEIGEIETCLRKHPSIKEVVVIARQDKNEQDYLCAYVVAQGEWTIQILRQFLGQALPHYMIPSYFMELNEIPLTTNGKVDKKAMPEPSGIGETGVEYAPPTNRTEETLVKIWQEVLGIERVGIHDNFFELGGHSLKATMMVNHIHKQLGVSLPIRELFKNPTIQQLEKYLEEVKLNTYASIPNTKEAEYYPVTSAQRRMYAIQNFEGEKLGVSYNIPEVFEIKGPLDSNKLNVALRKLINRHESLRTSFHLIGEQLVQKVHQEASWNLTKLRAKEYEIKNIIETFIKPFNLSEAPLFRAQLVEIGANHHIFMIDMHHIISDAVSSIIFMDELSQYYVDSELPDLRIQYKDYSAWQNSKEWIQQSEKQMKYWLDCLSGELPVLELPTDYARPPVQQLEGDVFTFEIKPETLSELKEMVHSQETTLFIALLTIYKVLLSKYSGQEDIIVGTPLSGRTHSDLEGIMGVFINTLVLRNQLKEEHKFIDLLSIVREGVLDSFEHADVPIEELISKLTLKRDVSRNPLFDTVFTFEQSEMNIDEAEINIPNLSFKYYDFDSSVAKFDMSWDAEEENGHLFFSVEYCTALFKQSTIERMSRHYIQILEQVIQQPDILLSEIELVTQAEKQQLLKDFNNTQVNYDKEKTIQELFEAQVKKTPNQLAVIFEDVGFTYQELNERANQLARVLRRKGVKPEQIVGILGDRSIETIVSILGVIKSGGAYLSIDPDYPEERIEYMLQDSSVSLLLAQRESTIPQSYQGECIFMDDKVMLQEDNSNLKNLNTSRSLAYVIYTSGSTGKPKGVMIEHGGVNNLRLMAPTYGIQEGSRILQFASFSFDASVGDVFHTLLSGATLYLLKKENLLEGEGFTKWLHEKRITSIPFIPPSILKTIPYVELPYLKTISTGGESLSIDLVKVWGVNRTFLNAYGPTEATVDSTIGVCVPEMEIMSIGRPIANKKVYILNEQYQLQPVGVPGEMYIGGDGLARGYLNRPELTEERFVSNPFVSEERMYKTGDLARWLPDGSIEYLGRVDDQVKIRGHRIEIGEIETCLRKHPSIKEVVVIARQDKNEQDYLCAYVVAQGEWTIQILRQFLGQALPHYMIPSYFMELNEIPLTTNGKVDKKAMPEPSGIGETGVEYAPPTNRTEETLVKIWQEVLGIERVGIHDNFFELGGDSIKAIQISARLRLFELRFEMKELFKYPTIFELSPFVSTTKLNIDQNLVEGTVDLTPIQHWFFDQNYVDNHHWNQSILLYKNDGWIASRVEQAFQKIVEHHDALRMTFQQRNGQVMQVNRGIDDNVFSLSVNDLMEEKDLLSAIDKKANEIQRSLDLSEGPLVGLGIFHTKDGDYLLITVHHLVIDGVSWRILMEDFEMLYNQLEKQLPPKTTSFQVWANKCKEYADSKTLLSEVSYWNEIEKTELIPIPKDKSCNDVYYLRDIENVTIMLTKESTTSLLTHCHHVYQTEINDLLLTALVLTIKQWVGTNKVVVDLEGHGREKISEDIDISRTIGWFTSIFPVVFNIEIDDLSHAIKVVKETLRRIPNKGVGHGLLKYLTKKEKSGMNFELKPEIVFNYLGQFDQEDEQFNMPMGDQFSLNSYNTYALEINSGVEDGQLYVEFSYSKLAFHRETIENLAAKYQSILINVISHCLQKEGVERTPSDFTENDMTLEELAEVFEALKS